MPPIEYTDVRQGVRKDHPPPTEHCIAQVSRILCFFQLQGAFFTFVEQMLSQVFASSDLESLPSAEAMSFACLFLGNMYASLCASRSFDLFFFPYSGVKFSYLLFKR